MFKSFKIPISIFIVWLFTISGIIGILNPSTTNWFLGLTYLNLLVTFIILLLNLVDFKKIYFVAFAIPFILGFVTEALGVNYGLIFGNYAYGENLGYKVFGVPLIICVNWALLTAITADVAKYFTKNLWFSALIGAALMTGLDVIIEISAPRFDFWEFEGGVVPLQNYVGWLVTAFVAHIGYQYFKVKTNPLVSWHILLTLVIFFTIFIIF